MKTEQNPKVSQDSTTTKWRKLFHFASGLIKAGVYYGIEGLID